MEKELTQPNNTWRDDKSTDWNLNFIAQSKTMQDLFQYAKIWYGLEAEKVREILRGGGYTNFKKECWWDYLNALREEWQHIEDLKAEPGWDKSRRQKLVDLVSKLEKAACPDGTWYWQGTSEQLAAKWELDELDRQKNVKRWRQCYFQSYLSDLRQVQGMNIKEGDQNV